MWNGFFNINEIKDIEVLKQLFRDALKLSFKSHVDILKGWKRERWDECTPEEYIETYITLNTHNVVIDRYAYSNISIIQEGEIGSSLSSPNIFLFIYLDLDNLYKIVEKYNLTKRLL